MATRPHRPVTPEEYLANERVAEYKSEYFAGEVFALAGASRGHNLIVTNLIVTVGGKLRGGGCDIYGSDLRVKVIPLGKYTYPDVTIACGGQEFEDDREDTLLNPTVIIEVLSDSTEKYDRGVKFEHYRRIVSLREYILVSQGRPLVEQYVRGEDGGWIFTEAHGPDGILVLSSIGQTLALSDIYNRVDS
jgi:Uma2 family endonuclease